MFWLIVFGIVVYVLHSKGKLDFKFLDEWNITQKIFASLGTGALALLWASIQFGATHRLAMKRDETFIFVIVVWIVCSLIIFKNKSKK